MTWHITNVRDAKWHYEGPFGVSANFQVQERFDELGFNLAVLWPGQPAAMYHREAHQEGFLVLAGECLAIVEGEEHPMKQWDYLHCPPWTDHIVVGAGDGPAFLIAVGSRTGEGGIVYPVDPAALKHKAGVEQETSESREAYAPFPEPVRTPFSEDYLPEVSPPTAPRSSR